MNSEGKIYVLGVAVQPGRIEVYGVHCGKCRLERMFRIGRRGQSARKRKAREGNMLTYLVLGEAWGQCSAGGWTGELLGSRGREWVC
jgi:hypothetical protein